MTRLEGMEFLTPQSGTEGHRRKLKDEFHQMALMPCPFLFKVFIGASPCSIPCFSANEAREGEK